MALGFLTDGVRQQFTGKERDAETGLDYFLARYYASVQGRFTSVDAEGPDLSNPQTLNKYRYALNNPLIYLDPDGNYEEDVHHDLTLALAYAAGFSLNQAEEIAANNQRVDVELDPIGSLGTNYGNRECCHFTTPGQRASLWNDFAREAQYYQGNEHMAYYYLGKYEHAEQDSFSHEGFGPVFGQATEVFKLKVPTLVDKTDTDPEKADRMAYRTFKTLVDARNAMSDPTNTTNRYGTFARPISYYAIKSLIHQWNQASDSAKKAAIMQKIMKKIENGRSIQRDRSTTVRTMTGRPVRGGFHRPNPQYFQ